MKRTRPTTTSLVQELLNKANDFLSFAQICSQLPGEDRNRISAALHHLYRHHAVDVLEAEVLYWYPTPQDDTRHWTCDTVKDGIVRPHTRPHTRTKRKSNERPKR